MNELSYISTTVFPIKIAGDFGLVERIAQHRIPPFHAKIEPTNKCPGNCSFCSFRNRDKNVELDYRILLDMTDMLIANGTKAVTITGGGDPMAYPQLNQYIAYLDRRGIQIGLITEGLLFKNADSAIFNMLRWCRISMSDERKFSSLNTEMIEKAKTDWAFSYMLSELYDMGNIMECIKFAKEHRFTHVRFVDDVMNQKSNALKSAKLELKDFLRNSQTKLIFQDTNQYAQGSRRCLSSLLKPSIDPYGRIMPCCGVSYADIPAMFNWSEKYSMGSNVDDIWQNQRYFDGSVCQRCFQIEHNRVLDMIWDSSEIEHREFV